jgi:uncharacterized protein with PQ loop repeat
MRHQIRFDKMLVRLLPFGVVIALAACSGMTIDTQSLLAPRFSRSEVVGFVSGLGTTFAALPDLLRMLRRRSSEGMNPTMSTIMCLFQCGWLYYGLLIASRPVIVWNGIGILINAFNVAAYRHFTRRAGAL